MDLRKYGFRVEGRAPATESRAALAAINVLKKAGLKIEVKPDKRGKFSGTIVINDVPHSITIVDEETRIDRETVVPNHNPYEDEEGEFVDEEANIERRVGVLSRSMVRVAMRSFIHGFVRLFTLVEVAQFARFLKLLDGAPKQFKIKNMKFKLSKDLGIYSTAPAGGKVFLTQAPVTVGAMYGENDKILVHTNSRNYYADDSRRNVSIPATSNWSKVRDVMEDLIVAAVSKMVQHKQRSIDEID
jgi:hypothetical protein